MQFGLPPKVIEDITQSNGAKNSCEAVSMLISCDKYRCVERWVRGVRAVS